MKGKHHIQAPSLKQIYSIHFAKRSDAGAYHVKKKLEGHGVSSCIALFFCYFSILEALISSFTCNKAIKAKFESW